MAEPFKNDIAKLQNRSVRALRTNPNGSTTIQVSGTNRRGQSEQINVIAGKGSGINSATGGAG